MENRFIIRDNEDKDIYSIIVTKHTLDEIENIISFIKSENEDWTLEDVYENLLKNNHVSKVDDISNLDIVLI